MTAQEKVRKAERNVYLANLKVSAEQVNTSIRAAQYAVYEAQETAKLINEHFREIREGLKIVEAKKLLKIRLNAKERALWTLYGKKTKKGEIL